jgi:hypothetical protein
MTTVMSGTTPSAQTDTLVGGSPLERTSSPIMSAESPGTGTAQPRR